MLPATWIAYRKTLHLYIGWLGYEFFEVSSSTGSHIKTFIYNLFCVECLLFFSQNILLYWPIYALKEKKATIWSRQEACKCYLQLLGVILVNFLAMRGKKQTQKWKSDLVDFWNLGKAGPLVHRAILFEDYTEEEDINWTAFSGPPVANLLFIHTGIKSVMIKMLKATPWNAVDMTSTWLVSIEAHLMHYLASTS